MRTTNTSGYLVVSSDAVGHLYHAMERLDIAHSCYKRSDKYEDYLWKYDVVHLLRESVMSVLKSQLEFAGILPLKADSCKILETMCNRYDIALPEDLRNILMCLDDCESTRECDDIVGYYESVDRYVHDIYGKYYPEIVSSMKSVIEDFDGSNVQNYIKRLPYVELKEDMYVRESDNTSAKLIPLKTLVGTTIMVAEPMRESIEKYLKLIPKYAIVKQLWLFGSVFETRCNKDSDIDLYVVYEGTRAKFKKMLRDIYNEYEFAAFDDILGCTVEDFNSVYASRVVHEVKKKGKLLYDINRMEMVQ